MTAHSNRNARTVPNDARKHVVVVVLVRSHNVAHPLPVTAVTRRALAL